jgi:hypothetical protein
MAHPPSPYWHRLAEPKPAGRWLVRDGAEEAPPHHEVSCADQAKGGLKIRDADVGYGGNLPFSN